LGWRGEKEKKVRGGEEARGVSLRGRVAYCKVNGCTGKLENRWWETKSDKTSRIEGKAEQFAYRKRGNSYKK